VRALKRQGQDPRSKSLWLGQSARTTLVTNAYPKLASARWMASLGDAIHRPKMLESVFGPQLRDRLRITGPLMLDSGGFTLMMRNGQLSLAEVTRAFNTAAADVVISLDYPPLATDAEDVRRDKYNRTLANFATLHRESFDASLAPVIHGTGHDELRSNCDAVSGISPAPDWVCLGGVVPLLRQSGQLGAQADIARERLQNSIQTVRERFPTSQLHVLGVGSPRTIAMAYSAGADSVDSIGWRRAAGFGTIFLPGGTERFVVNRDRKRATSRLTLTEADRAALGVCECPVCSEHGTLDARIEKLASSYLPRAAHNAWVLLAEAKSFDADP
jgi:tRNA-guanine family transglycosylase